ncbi:MAG: hypothetical protein EPN69_14170 [Rhodanobacter sp.]|nr:MAG: hypothetical protein EPN69_14170 [Rhodanobacter sp.]TAM41223.1 MAG: hypothetical protein EPN58_07560 [Rhodanobacter sp.]TAN25346.1 MAG: hypothetical protein EPN32_09985 [Rhodanobacter sp.]
MSLADAAIRYTMPSAIRKLRKAQKAATLAASLRLGSIRRTACDAPALHETRRLLGEWLQIPMPHAETASDAGCRLAAVIG